MKSSRFAVIALVGVVVASLWIVPDRAGEAAVVAERAEQTARHIDRELALRTFDVAWERVKHTYFDEDFGGLDWDAVRDELRPKVEEVESMAELRSMIQEMLNRLGQSHFAIVPSDLAGAIDPDEAIDEDVDAPHTEPREADAPTRPRDGRPGHTGIELYTIDDQVIVVRVQPDSPAAELGVRPGWKVTGVRGRDVKDLAQHIPEHLDERSRARFLWQMVEVRFRGSPGTSVFVSFVDEANEEIALEIPRISIEGESTKIGNMPTMFAHLEHDLLEREGGDVRIGVIRFNIWMLPVMKKFGDALHELSDADGIVIDLRGNPGGIGALAMSVAGFFTEERFSLGTMANRKTNIEFRAIPQFSLPGGEPFDPYPGPVAILIDTMTGSTSEIFAAGMQDSGRARVFGRRSYGAVLPSVFYRLPNGDVLQHAISDFVSSAGVRLEGRGVEPDESVSLTRKALLDGRDPVLEAALEWIANKSMKREAALSE